MHRMQVLVLAGAQFLSWLIAPQAFCATVESGVIERHREVYEEIHRRRYSCGINALYAILCMRGRNVETTDVTDALGRCPDYPGHSLAQLQRAAESLGLPCSVKYLTREELESNSNLPVIAHFHTTLSGERGSVSGHFVVLVELTKDRVSYFDPVTLSFGFRAPESFLNQWTGYILQPSDSNWWPLQPAELVSVVGVLTLLVLLAGCWRRHAAGPKTADTAPKGMTVSCLIVAAWLFANPAWAVDNQYQRIWRDSAHDSTNICYVFLSLHGVNTDYEDIESQLALDVQGSSLKSMMYVCANYGLPSVALKACPEDLQKLPLPIVLHMSERVEHGGVLALMVARDSNGVLVMQGTTCIINHLTWDSLRRNWSGYAVVSSREKIKTIHLGYDIAISVAAILLAALSRKFWRSRKSPMNNPISYKESSHAR